MSSVVDEIKAALLAGRNADAIHRALAGAAAGDAQALTILAHWRLAGSVLPRDLPASREYLRRAAQLGDVEAARTEIALTANGSGGPRDWAGALAQLRAAPGNADDLALLAAMKLDDAGNPKVLSKPQVMCANPQVELHRGFLSRQECALVAQSVLDILEPSMVADPRTGRSIPHPIRDSSAAPIGPTRESLPLQAILHRIAAATGTSVRQGESLTVLHYRPGQQYREHLDTLPGVANQRIATFIIYLNEGHGGGETRFPMLDLTIRAKLGDALFFRNVLPDGRPDPRSCHAGLPVTAGIKWVATRWIRAHDFDVWNPD